MNNILKDIRLFMALAACSFYATASFAQNGYTTDERMALDKALTTIENYEDFCTAYDDETYYNFIDLFKSDDMLILNDILGNSKAGKMIKVEDYAKYMRDKARSTRVFIGDIKRNRIWQENGLWKVEYSFEKNTTYSTNECGVLLSSSEFYGKNYSLTAVVAYNREKDEAHIESIDGEIGSTKTLPDDFYVFVKDFKNENEDLLRYKGLPLEFNVNNQAFLDSRPLPSDFTFYDVDMLLKPQIDDSCRIVTMKYKYRKAAMKAFYAQGLGNSLSLQYNNKLSSSKSSSSWMGIDFGFSISSSKNVKTKLFLGLGITQTKLDLAYNNSEYKFNANTTSDVEGLNYIRYYENLTMQQTVKFNELTVPLYLDFDFRLAGWCSAYLDLGFTPNMILSKSTSECQGTAKVYGIYPDLNNLLMDEHWGFNGFSDNATFSKDNIDDPDLNNFNQYSVDALGGAGFCFRYKKFGLNLGVSYRMGLMDISNDNSRLTNNVGMQDESLVHNVIYDSTYSKEVVHSLTKTVGSIKRNMIALNVGVSMKL